MESEYLLPLQPPTKYMAIVVHDSHVLTILAPYGTAEANFKLVILMDENYLHYSFILGVKKGIGM